MNDIVYVPGRYCLLARTCILNRHNPTRFASAQPNERLSQLVDSCLVCPLCRLVSTRLISHRNFEQIPKLQVLHVVGDVLIVLQIASLVVFVIPKFSIRLRHVLALVPNCLRKSCITHHQHTLQIRTHTTCIFELQGHFLAHPLRCNAIMFSCHLLSIRIARVNLVHRSRKFGFD